MTDTGMQIKRARNARGLTLQNLADKIGVSGNAFRDQGRAFAKKSDIRLDEPVKTDKSDVHFSNIIEGSKVEFYTYETSDPGGKKATGEVISIDQYGFIIEPSVEFADIFDSSTIRRSFAEAWLLVEVDE